MCVFTLTPPYPLERTYFMDGPLSKIVLSTGSMNESGITWYKVAGPTAKYFGVIYVSSPTHHLLLVFHVLQEEILSKLLQA